MTITAYQPPPSEGRASTQTRDYTAVLARIRDVEAELGDLTVPVITVPLRDLDDCSACVDDATVGPFNPLESTVSVVHVTAGRRYVQDCCPLHAHLYVDDAVRQGRPVVVEIPALPVTEVAA